MVKEKVRKTSKTKTGIKKRKPRKSRKYRKSRSRKSRRRTTNRESNAGDINRIRDCNLPVRGEYSPWNRVLSKDKDRRGDDATFKRVFLGEPAHTRQLSNKRWNLMQTCWSEAPNANRAAELGWRHTPNVHGANTNALANWSEYLADENNNVMKNHLCNILLNKYSSRIQNPLEKTRRKAFISEINNQLRAQDGTPLCLALNNTINAPRKTNRISRALRRRSSRGRSTKRR